jgi:hypothetical protein
MDRGRLRLDSRGLGWTPLLRVSPVIHILYNAREAYDVCMPQLRHPEPRLYRITAAAGRHVKLKAPLKKLIMQWRQSVWNIGGSFPSLLSPSLPFLWRALASQKFLLSHRYS